jgi:hypothetical protein
MRAWMVGLLACRAVANNDASGASRPTGNAMKAPAASSHSSPSLSACCAALCRLAEREAEHKEELGEHRAILKQVQNLFCLSCNGKFQNDQALHLLNVHLLQSTAPTAFHAAPEQGAGGASVHLHQTALWGWRWLGLRRSTGLLAVP